MSDQPTPLSPRFLLAGQLTRDYALLPGGQTRLDVLGGNVLAAAAGLAVWEPAPPPGIVARVGEDYPQEWLEKIGRAGIDIRGVHVLPQAVDTRNFYAYLDRMTRLQDDPIAQFARAGVPFPKELFGYPVKNGIPDSRSRLSPVSLRQGDLPAAYLEATAAHICPLDYLTHSLLPAVLRQAGFTTVTLDPGAGYMTTAFRDDLPALVTGLTAFLPSEDDLRAIFHGRIENLWEMAEAIAVYGCEIVVIKCGEAGQMLYDAASKVRYIIPPYPVKVVDLTGAGDAFCGGFLAGYRKTFDPLMAVLHGNISAAMTIEGYGPLYALGSLPGLAQARLDALRQSVRKV